MKDLYKKPIFGHIIVECSDKNGTVVDRFEKHNLIMDTARVAVSSLACGLSTAEPINKFVLGTDGHIPGDFLTPKGEAQGFISSRTQLFSEETSGFTYPIDFTNPGTASGSCTINSEPDSGSTITMSYVGNDVEYTITVPELAGNGTGISVFTEAALYAGGNIFSMKTFPAKIKDDSVSLKIIWKILF